MPRNKTRKTQPLVEQEITVRQDVVTSGVQGQSFDLVMRFTDSALQPELYMDELVKMVIEGLIQQYGEILVKINWFDSNLMVIAPNKLPADDFLDASVTSPDGSGATVATEQ